MSGVFLTDGSSGLDEARGSIWLLLRSGDVETNPGPFQEDNLLLLEDDKTSKTARSETLEFVGIFPFILSSLVLNIWVYSYSGIPFYSVQLSRVELMHSVQLSRVGEYPLNRVC